MFIVMKSAKDYVCYPFTLYLIIIYEALKMVSACLKVMNHQAITPCPLHVDYISFDELYSVLNVW